MLEHAAGALPAGLDLAAGLHVALSAGGAGRAATWDAVGGALLEREDVMETPATRPARRYQPEPAPAMSVHDLLATDLDALKWRRTITQARCVQTGVPGARFMRLQPGQSIPRHGHSALEATVVLRGILTVDGDVYRYGDLMLGLPGEAHKPGAGGDVPCICLVARGERPFWRLT
jgi:putative transcriptional regulator